MWGGSTRTRLWREAGMLWRKKPLSVKKMDGRSEARLEQSKRSQSSVVMFDFLVS